MNRYLKLALLAFVCAAGVVSPGNRLPAQSGVSSGSVSYALASRGLPSERYARSHGRLQLADIRVEEFVNYHRHQIPMPQDDERVHLDLRCNTIDDDNSILQVGLATPQEIDLESARPLNLVIVIDRSGSMSGDRIANVKESLHALVQKLRDKDLITIVAFSTDAEIVLRGSRTTEREVIDRAIDRIEANGSTNLHAGLMLGYEQAQEHFDSKKTNRVILLSDGIANVGTTDSAAIAAESQRFSEQGIDLATIGLGHNFNQELLRKLADEGRGVMHFVDDGQDIEKTFVDEIESLLVPVARQIELTIDFGDRDGLIEVYGYEPKRNGDKVSLELIDLNRGATQVVLAKIRTPNRSTRVCVTLSYLDANTRKPVECVNSIQIANDDEQSDLANGDVRKNYVIARLANAIKKCVPEANQGDFKTANKKLSTAVSFARVHFEQGADEDVDRIIGIAKSYQSQVQSALEIAYDE